MKKLFIVILLLISINAFSQQSYIGTTTIKASTRLRNQPSSSGEVITTIKKNKTIKVLKYSGDSYWQVEYKNEIGFVNDVTLVITEEMNKAIKEDEGKKVLSELKQKQDILAAQQKKRAERKEKLAEKYGVLNANFILNGKLFTGMTKEMVIESIGKPDDINKTTGPWGVHEQWVYDKKNMYVYFENGKLTSWQE